MDKQNIFLTDGIICDDYDHEDFERYEFTKTDLKASDYPSFKTRKDKTLSFKDWAEENLSTDELLEVPVMNCLRYFPDFIEFTEEDRYKVAGNTTLFYDTKKEAWAVGMTGGGMDLSPHLLDTFIALGKGIPFELAGSINKNYSAYVENKKHFLNCKLLAKAYKEKGKQFIAYAKDLT